MSASCEKKAERVVSMNDNRGRAINYLRISVTDRCNLRCRYCMPEEGTELFSHEEMLSLEELVRVCRCAADLGISRIKLTGGEPLVRKNVAWLVEQILEIPGIENVTMTSNGILLTELAGTLKGAGLSCVNVSLDTLDAERFALITRRDSYHSVIQGIRAAQEAGLEVKINCAVSEDFREQDVTEFAAFSVENRIPVRFIEMMPIGQGRRFTALDNDRLLEALKRAYPDVALVKRPMGNGPAVYYEFAEGKGCAGFISAVHHRFCGECNRIRLTSDGYLKLCLAHEDGISLRDAIRSGMGDEGLKALMEETIYRKPECHGFGEEDESETSVNMNRIGG